MGVLQSIDGCLKTSIGPSGLTEGELQQNLSRLQPSLEALKRSYHEKSLPLLHVAEQTQDIADAREALQKLSTDAETIIFLGTGGSSLGGQTLAQFGGWSIPGDQGPSGQQLPRVRFYDNLDPRTYTLALERLEFEKTRFIVTSKSGGTGETLVQTLATLDAVRSRGLEAKIPHLFLGLTEPEIEGGVNPLRALFRDLDVPMLEHNPGVGGRYSVLTNVGLLPALARGLNVEALRSGARKSVEAMLAAGEPADCPAALGAAVTIGLSKSHDVSNIVMLPYADRLERFSRWFVQLWAESLGKQGEGTYPIANLGPVDQHSQLQLYMDGPNTLMVNIIRTSVARTGPGIPADLAGKTGLDYLGGRQMGDLVDAQQHAIGQALIGAGRAVRTIDLDPFDEESMGELLMHFMLETIFAAGLLGIDPFDQPAVETGKILAKNRLAESG